MSCVWPILITSTMSAIRHVVYYAGLIPWFLAPRALFSMPRKVSAPASSPLTVFFASQLRNLLQLKSFMDRSEAKNVVEAFTKWQRSVENAKF